MFHPDARERTASALFDLTERLGAVVESARVTSAVDRALADAPDEGSPFERLVRSARRAGLVVDPVRLSPRVLLDMGSRTDASVLAAIEDGAPAVLEPRGRRVRVEALGGEPARLLDVESLARTLGAPTPDHEVELAMVRALPPSEAHDAHEAPLAAISAWLRAERGDLGVLVVYGAATGFFSLAVPIAVQAMVTTFAFGAMMQPLVVLAMVVLACTGLAAVLRGLETWVVEVLERRLFVRAATRAIDGIVHLDPSAVPREEGPRLANRFFETFLAQKAMATLLLDGLEVLLTTSVGLVVLAFYHPALLAFDLVLVFLLSIVLFGLGRGGIRTAIDESKAKHAFVEWLEDALLHHGVWKTAGADAYVRLRTSALARDYLLARASHFRVLMRQIVGALVLQALAGTGVLLVGGSLVLAGTLTLGQLVAAEIIVASVVAAMGKLGKQLASFYDLTASLGKLETFLEMPKERDEGTSMARREGPASVVVREVSFGRGDHVVEVPELVVRAREHVALAPSEAAHALARVLFGAQAPEGGVVHIDDADVRTLDLVSLRARVALVREAEVFDASAAENVRVGREDVRGDDVARALAAVGLREPLEARPGGLHAKVSPFDPELALGLTFARALAGRPSLFVVDGALDRLPAEMRARVVDALFREDAPFTAWVVTSDPLVLARAKTHLVVRGRELVREARS